MLTVAVLTPYLLDRFAFKRHVIRYPIRSGRHWTLTERIYMFSVLGLAWLILPNYFINSGTYLNWPAPREPSELARLFVGVNAVGLWDELFFICGVFTLLRRHFPIWQANLLQAVIFVSFLWELGYTELGAVAHLSRSPWCRAICSPEPAHCRTCCARTWSLTACCG